MFQHHHKRVGGGPANRDIHCTPPANRHYLCVLSMRKTTPDTNVLAATSFLFQRWERHKRATRGESRQHLRIYCRAGPLHYGCPMHHRPPRVLDYGSAMALPKSDPSLGKKKNRERVQGRQQPPPQNEQVALSRPRSTACVTRRQASPRGTSSKRVQRCGPPRHNVFTTHFSTRTARTPIITAANSRRTLS